MTGNPIDKEKLAECETQLDICLDKIDKIFLREASFLGGNEISVADLLGICELMQPYAVGHDVFHGRPKLDSWAKRVQQQLQPDFDQAHTFLFKLKEMFPPSPKL